MSRLSSLFLANHPALYTIDPDHAFLKSLASLFTDFSERDNVAQRAHVFLPTRRAIRAFQQDMLNISDGAPVILPRLRPLGDDSEDDVIFSAGSGMLSENADDIPPAITPIKRRFILARELMAARPLGEREITPDQALELAAALGRLMDRLYNEGLSWDAINGLIHEENLATHWQITLDFLETISRSWPDILAERGVIDAVDRRNRMSFRLAELWSSQPPPHPVIAAGSTGSLPATAALLKAVADMPQGAVILPGLDRLLDDESWEALDDQHPQATMKQLLAHNEWDRNLVRPFPDPVSSAPDHKAGQEKSWFLREVLRPPQTTDRWADLVPDDAKRDALIRALAPISLAECEHPQDEADFIALKLRETMQTKGRTALVITPDRDLAGRVRAACRRWDMEIDDSAGRPLASLPAGSFFLQILDVMDAGFAPATLMSLLRHDLCRACMREDAYQKAINILDKSLRGMPPARGWEGLRAKLEENGANKDQEVSQLLLVLEDAFQSLEDKADDFSARLRCHIECAEKLASTAQDNESATPHALWGNEDGEALSELLAQILEDSAPFRATPPSPYREMIDMFLREATVRPKRPGHKRIAILGQLEARILQADLIIMAGLNEGTWPPAGGHDPFLSRAMMAACGLPGPERKVGQAAHDFRAALGAPEVLITRSRRVGGKPTIPARWLQRMEAVAHACGLPQDFLTAKQTALLTLSRQLSQPLGLPSPAERPAPTPPLSLRPKGLSVTKIEDWLINPYAIYVRYILGLRPWDTLEKEPDAIEIGNMLHEILKDFGEETREHWPGEVAALARLREIGHEKLQNATAAPAFWHYYTPRFDAIAAFVCHHEENWRKKARPLLFERQGKTSIKTQSGRTFTLSAIADRVDRLQDGTLAYIDYKSGTSLNATNIRSTIKPQLPLTGWIGAQGGFPAPAPKAEPGYFAYWQLHGSREAGALAEVANDDNNDCSDIAADAAQGLTQLIEAFEDENRPYTARPNPARTPKFDDYEHLARLQEWSAGGPGEDSEGGE